MLNISIHSTNVNASFISDDFSNSRGFVILVNYVLDNSTTTTDPTTDTPTTEPPTTRTTQATTTTDPIPEGNLCIFTFIYISCFKLDFIFTTSSLVCSITS